MGAGGAGGGVNNADDDDDDDDDDYDEALDASYDDDDEHNTPGQVSKSPSPKAGTNNVLKTTSVSTPTTMKPTLPKKA